MIWEIHFDQRVDKLLSKLNPIHKKEILAYLNKLLDLHDPRELGKPLLGNYKGLWRYRVHKFRIICEIKDKELIVLVLNIGKRDDIY